MRCKVRNAVSRSITMLIAVPVIFVSSINSSFVPDMVWSYLLEFHSSLCEGSWTLFMWKRKYKSGTICCFYFLSGNPPLDEQWTIKVWSYLRINSLFWFLDIVYRLIPWGETHHVKAVALSGMDLNGYFVRTKSFISNSSLKKIFTEGSSLKR